MSFGLESQREQHPRRKTPAALTRSRAVGDALAPRDVRRYAEGLDGPTDDSNTTPYRRELTGMASNPAA